MDIKPEIKILHLQPICLNQVATFLNIFWQV